MVNCERFSVFRSPIAQILADLQAIGGYRYVYYSEDTDLCWRFQGREAMQPPLGKYRVHQQRPHYGIRFRMAGLSALRLQIIPRKQTIPIVYSAGWAVRRTVAEPQR